MAKPLLKLFVILIALFAVKTESKASHIMGSDMEYECYGDSFLITLKLYRDCRGIFYNATEVVTITSSDCPNLNFTQGLALQDSNDITPVCGVLTNCSGGSWVPGIQEWIYKGWIYLGGARAGCCNWKIGYFQSARNGDIQTGQSGQNFYTDMQINRCLAPCNNSPKFSNIPMAILCKDQCITLNMGVVDSLDVPRDSFSYHLVEPMQADGISCSYVGSYGPTRPIHFGAFPNINAPWSPNCLGFHLDPVTGDLRFKPTVAQNGVIAIEVREWRVINGVYELIGKSRRDLQVIIKDNCNNDFPNLSTVPLQEVCALEPVTINMTSSDPDGDSTKLFWNRGIPKGTFTTTNGTVKNASGTFTWTPGENDASNVPYQFTVTVKDAHCPIIGMNTRSYSVLVKPLPKMTLQKIDSGCGKYYFNIVPIANYYLPSYELRINNQVFPVKTMTHQFKTGGQHVIRYKMIANGCPRTYYDTVVIDTPVIVDLPVDTFICNGKSINFGAIAKWGSTPYRYTWNTGNPADSLNSLTASPTITTMYKLTVKDAGNCQTSDSIEIEVKNLPEINLGPDLRICNYQNTTIDAGDNGGNGQLKYQWTGPNGFSDTTQIVLVDEEGNYHAKIQDNFGCQNRDTLLLNVNPTVPVLALPDTSVCAGTVFEIRGQGADYYEWFKNTSNLGNLPTLEINPPTTTSYILKGTKTIGGVSCINYDTVTVTVNPKPVVAPVTLSPKCPDYGTVFLPLLTNTTGNGQNVVWSSRTHPGAVGNGTLKIDTAGGTGPGYHYIQYTLTDNKGCVKIDSVMQRVYEFPLVIANSNIYCHNAANPVLIKKTSFGMNSGNGSSIGEKWTGKGIFPQGPNWMFNPALADTGLNIMRYEYKDMNGCKNSDTAAFYVRPVPVPNSGNVGPFCLGQFQTLDLNIAANPYPAGGWWDVVTSTPGNPIVTPANPVITMSKVHARSHILMYSDSSTGCLVQDTMRLVINDTPGVKIIMPGSVCATETTPIKAIVNPGMNPNFHEFIGNGMNQQGFFDIAAAGEGTHKIIYRYTSQLTKCTNEDTATIIVKPAPEVNISPIQAICEGMVIDLHSSFDNASGIRWESHNGDTTKFISRSNPNTSYTPTSAQISSGYADFTLVSVGHAVECKVDSETIKIPIFPIPQGKFETPDVLGCEPLLSNFVATATNMKSDSIIFKWNFGDDGSGLANEATGINVEHTYKKAGLYSVKVNMESLAGCSNSMEKAQYIRVNPFPKAEFTADKEFTTIALPKFAFTNKSSISEGGGQLFYHWDFGVDNIEHDTSSATNPIYTYNDTNNYPVTLKVTSEYGCTDEYIDSFRVDPDITVFIPNAFTPNNFGPKDNNNFFVVAEGYTAFEILIFNRWGEKVYESTERLPGWNGREFNTGEHCQQDVYVYKVSVTSFNGKVYKYYGTITLLR